VTVNGCSRSGNCSKGGHRPLYLASNGSLPMSYLNSRHHPVAVYFALNFAVWRTSSRIQRLEIAANRPR
jgi:hypothetical protein